MAASEEAKAPPRITGTFLDEITHDIPTQSYPAAHGLYRGEVTHRFKGGPYEGCFHVPRALWLCWRLLQKLEAEA